MYRERGWVPEFEKQLRKTDPFATEVTWKFLPGLVCRQCALTPSLCRGVLLFQCCLVPFKRSGGWGVITWPFLVAPSPAEEVPAFSPCVSFPSLQRIPAPQLRIPLVRQFFVWHLCTVNCGNSVSREHRLFLPFLFGENQWEEIFVF